MQLSTFMLNANALGLRFSLKKSFLLCKFSDCRATNGVKSQTKSMIKK